MAVRRAWWIVGPVAAALLAAALLLPPQIPDGRRGSWSLAVGGPDWTYVAGSGRSPYRDDVRDAQRRQTARLHHARLADSILRAARGPRALRTADGAVTVVYERPLVKDSARFWLEAVLRELDAYPPATGASLPLVVALFSEPVRAKALGPYWEVQELPDQVVTKRACVVLVALFAPFAWRQVAYLGHDAAGRPATRLLDACGLVARYGAPGSLIADWAWGDATYWSARITFVRQLVNGRRPLPLRLRRADVRMDAYWWQGGDRWRDIGCARGLATPCLFTAGLAQRSAVSPAWYRSRVLPPERLMAYLLATGTPAQFASFWRSPAPPAEALQRAYGKPAGDLALAALQHWYDEPAPGGPGASAGTLLTAAGWAVVAVALALVAGHRRRLES